MIRLIVLVVFLGWIMIWVMLPTKLYDNKWTPKLTSKLINSKFEVQGTNLLLFSFPVMFIAISGCVYLHLQKKLKNSSSKRVVTSKRLSFLRRPVLVMAPLGIFTAVEIAFAVMFIALLIWSLANYLYVSFGHLHMDKQGEKVWQAKFRSVSLRLGYIGNICWAFLFFPVTRGSSVLPLVGLTSESSIKYHIWLGHLSMILFAAHTIGFIIYWGMTNQMALMLEWSKTWVSNVAGEIAMVLALAIYLRFLQSTKRARLMSARLLPCGSIELNFSKSTGLYYNPTSIIFLNVPCISKLQWHPFTVTSNCNMEPDKLSVVIKRQGSWSQKLYQQLSSSNDIGLELSVEGPYGPASSHFLRHELLVMVCGGSGITPFISIIRQIIFQSAQPNSHNPQVLLVCAFKNTADLTMLDLLLPVNNAPIQITQVNLQIEAYITRETQQPIPDSETLLRTIWFKPNPSDSPITAALGPNNWLWLGAIIASSFVMFLVLLGIITRFYIYPIDHNTSEIYHFSYFVLWDTLLVCACVIITCSAAFLWCKSKNAQQIQNLEVPTPTASPGDRELESLPHESLVQATKLHFGARPDLNRILLERKGVDVGVLACGPRAMRHEVAKICSSGLADNLHFESISFDW
ncbi:hypothetical protein JCGZ_26070 [Jatropha curcas]|uniref:ferric-chelate reductase (NADH) n=1 Tax=Jatropha curcas TaxID=180498 RepID=A0A067JRV3_JATCU|nr:hypothetical protein JCGZ_26070 [Jatropha curcas]